MFHLSGDNSRVGVRGKKPRRVHCGSAPGSTAWVRGRALGEADGGVVVLVYMNTVLYMYTETVYTKTVYTDPG